MRLCGLCLRIASLIFLNRYSKALDAIKALRKERTAQLIQDKRTLEHFHDRKLLADKLKTRLTDSHSTIANKETEHEELQEVVRSMRIENKDFYEKATKFQEILTNAQSVAEQKRAAQQRYNEQMNGSGMRLLEGNISSAPSVCPSCSY